MSIWNKQDWIKDILSKSGTEITEIKDEENKGGLICGIAHIYLKNVRQMVFIVVVRMIQYGLQKKELRAQNEYIYH